MDVCSFSRRERGVDVFSQNVNPNFPNPPPHGNKQPLAYVLPTPSGILTWNEWSVKSVDSYSARKKHVKIT